MSAGFFRRFLATAIDSTLVLLLAVLLAGTSGEWFAERWWNMFSVGEPHSRWQGLVPMLLGFQASINYGVPMSALLILLPEALVGTSAGKALLRAYIVVLSDDGSVRPARVRQLWKRYLAKLSGGVLLVLAMATERIEFAVVGGLLTVVIAVGAAAVIMPGGRALHDRLSGTVVWRGRQRQ